MVRDGESAKGIDDFCLGMGRGVIEHSCGVVVAVLGGEVILEKRVGVIGVLGVELLEGIFELADAGSETCDAAVEVFGGGEDEASSLTGGKRACEKAKRKERK